LLADLFLFMIGIWFQLSLESGAPSSINVIGILFPFSVESGAPSSIDVIVFTALALRISLFPGHEWFGSSLDELQSTCFPLLGLCIRHVGACHN